MADQLLAGIAPVFDSTGNIVAGGSVTFYQTGTTTLVPIWANQGATDSLTNPVTLDAAGRAPQIFYTGSVAVKEVIKGADGVIIDTIDPSPRFSTATSAADEVSFSPIESNPNTDVQAAIASVSVLLAAQRENPSASASGTANAIALTSGKSFTSIPVGQEFSFFAAATNTGAATISVDGLVAVAVKDIYGQPLRPGQITAGVYTTVVYDGTNFVDVRQVRSISAAIPTTSGTAFTVTGIDPLATEISILFNAVSLNTDGNSILVRLGTAGGVIVSGYASTSYSNAAESSTTGFVWQHNTAAGTSSKGIMTIKKAAAGVWMASLGGALSPTTASYGGGMLTGAGDPITTVSVARTASATFNFGSFHVETRR